MRKQVSQGHPDREVFQAAKKLFKREVLYAGLAGAVLGGRYAHGRAVQNVLDAQILYDRSTLAQERWGVIIDDVQGKSPYKEACENTGGNNVKECVERLQHQSVVLTSLLDDMARNGLVSARKSLLTKTISGAVVGGLTGTVLAIGALAVYLKICIRREERRILAARPVVDEAPASEGEPEPMVEAESKEDIPTLKIRMVREADEQDPMLAQKKRIEKENDIERAIRGVCGGKYSKEVGYALASVLSHRQIHLLIEEPENLKKVLFEHREELRVEFSKYAITLDRVLEEIYRREEQPDKNGDSLIRSR